jgi:hypothetical protein
MPNPVNLGLAGDILPPAVQAEPSYSSVAELGASPGVNPEIANPAV